MTSIDLPVAPGPGGSRLAGTVHVSRDGTEPIPRLEDVLNAWPDLRLVVDPKSDDVVGPLIEALQRTNARDRVCVGSFSAHRLRWIRADAPGYTSCSPFEVVRLRAESWSMPLGTWKRTAHRCLRVNRSSATSRFRS